MSFKCQSCREPQPSRERPHTVILEIRKAVYPPRDRAYGRETKDPGGFGEQIAKEKKVCDSCKDKLVDQGAMLAPVA